MTHPDEVYIFYDFPSRLRSHARDDHHRDRGLRQPGARSTSTSNGRRRSAGGRRSSSRWSPSSTGSRSTWSPGALPAIQDHFGFGDTVAGAIPTAAALAGVVLLLPAGRLADSGTRTSIVALVVLVWSVCSVLSGLATSFALFFVTRILLGAAGQLYNPPASSLLADYYPSRTPRQGLRARARRLLHRPAGRVSRSAASSLRRSVGAASSSSSPPPGCSSPLLVLTLSEPIRGIGDRLDVMRGRRPEPPTRVTPSSPASPRTVLRDALGAAGDPHPARRGRPAWLCSTWAWAACSTGYRPSSSAPRTSTTTQRPAWPAASAAPASCSASSSAAGSATAATAAARATGSGPAGRFLLLGAIALTAAVTLPGLPIILTAIALVVRRLRRRHPQPHRRLGRRGSGRATGHGLRAAAVPAHARRCRSDRF